MKNNTKTILVNLRKNKMNLIIFLIGVILAMCMLIYTAITLVSWTHYHLFDHVESYYTFRNLFADSAMRFMFLLTIFMGVFYAIFIMAISIFVIHIRTRRKQRKA
jgi:uncharacterized membrane protein YphA (DoxX/SURF4 family)